MSHENLSVETYFQTKPDASGVLEPHPDSPDSVLFHPVAVSGPPSPPSPPRPGEDACRGGIPIRRDAFEWVRRTGHWAWCKGRNRDVVEVKFKEGATLSVSEAVGLLGELMAGQPTACGCSAAEATCMDDNGNQVPKGSTTCKNGLVHRCGSNGWIATGQKC